MNIKDTKPSFIQNNLYEYENIKRDKFNSLIHSFYLRKDFNECLKLIENVLKSCNSLSEYPLYVKAMILRRQGNLEESLIIFQAALCLNPSNIINLKQVGRSLYLLSKYKAALEVLTEAEKINSEDREIWHFKGMCYISYQKQYEKAIECFEIANSILRHESTYIQLGKIFRLIGRDQDALDIYLDAVETCPDNPEILTMIGLLYLKLGDNENAFSHLNDALKLDPKSVKAILAAGSVIQDKQDPDGALMKYQWAIHQSPNSSELWNNIGMCFFGKGSYIRAIGSLKKALYLSPFEWIISFNLGVVYLTNEQYASAFQAFSTSINLQSTYAKAYLLLAVTLSYLDDFDNSCAAYEKSIELQIQNKEEDYVTYLNYAITLCKYDQLDQAKVKFLRFQTLLQLNDSNSSIDIDVIEQSKLLSRVLL